MMQVSWLRLAATVFFALSLLPAQEQRDINPMEADTGSFGAIDNITYFTINEFSGDISANLDPIGPAPLSVTPRYKSPNRQKGFALDYGRELTFEGALGASWHLGFGMLLVQEHHDFDCQENRGYWEKVTHVDGGGNLSPFTRDLTFVDVPNGKQTGNNGFGPDLRHLQCGSSTNMIWRPGVKDAHFIDGNLRRLTRAMVGNAAEGNYFLLDTDGSKTEFAPTHFTHTLNANHGVIVRTWVPVSKTFPNGRKITIEYEETGVTPSGDIDSWFIKKIIDHANERSLRFHYSPTAIGRFSWDPAAEILAPVVDSGGNQMVSQINDADPFKRYVTKITLEGPDGSQHLADFSYIQIQDDLVDNQNPHVYLEAVERSISEIAGQTQMARTEINLGLEIAPARTISHTGPSGPINYTETAYAYFLVNAITSPLGGTTALTYQVVDFDIEVGPQYFSQCRVDEEGGCDPNVPNYRAQQIRIEEIGACRCTLFVPVPGIWWTDRGRFLYQGGAEPIECTNSPRYLKVFLWELQSDGPSRLRLPTHYPLPYGKDLYGGAGTDAQAGWKTPAEK